MLKVGSKIKSWAFVTISLRIAYMLRFSTSKNGRDSRCLDRTCSSFALALRLINVFLLILDMGLRGASLIAIFNYKMGDSFLPLLCFNYSNRDSIRQRSNLTTFLKRLILSSPLEFSVERILFTLVLSY